MKILVCVKQVPDTESLIVIDQSGRWIETASLVFHMNRYDEYAVEEALLIKETVQRTVVDALSVGPARVRNVIKRALEMGADNGIHIALPEERYYDPLTIASLIRRYAHDQGYDLILCGIMAEDDLQSQVGPMLAEMLGIPCATSVISQRLADDLTRISVEREIEGGERERFELALPALLAVQSGMNRPRYPALSNVLRAKRQELITIDVGDMPHAQGQASITLRYPEHSQRGVLLSGSMREKAQALLRILHAHAFL